jgi:septal ring factor EnvC (AmiA/AmiB activator)
MDARQRHVATAQVPPSPAVSEESWFDGSTAAPRHQRKELEQEWQDQLRVLQQWICELLIKNQQLREALASANRQQAKETRP